LRSRRSAARSPSTRICRKCRTFATALGATAIERQYPAAGQLVDVAGGRLHLLEIGSPDGVPVALLHGASGNLHDLRSSLGGRLSRHRVILIDRPGHGWSDRPGGDDDSSPERQAMLVAQALEKRGIKRAVMVGYSWSGALATAYTLAYPDRVAALVLLAPVVYPWPGGIAWYYRLAATPVIGPLFARTIVLPLGFPLIGALARGLFMPQGMPDGYVRDAAIPMVLRPREFAANAHDVAALKGNVRRQSPRYGEIAAPTVIITGDRDTIVSPTIHSKALAAMLPHAKLIVLPGIGHAVQHVAANVVAAEIEQLIAVILGKPGS
jgi:pimeloyl-ACP methyl ester carboxylesterase